VTSIDIIPGVLDFVMPYETAGYIVAVFLNTDGEDYDVRPAEMLPYGFFTGENAAAEAEAFGEKYIEPTGNEWRTIPVQAVTLYRWIDRLRDIVTDRTRSGYGRAWTPHAVASLALGRDWPLITPDEAERILLHLVDEGVMVRDGDRRAWTVNPDHKEK